jgi:hypothetical protein
MTVGILGAGRMGTALARAIAGTGERVLLCSARTGWPPPAVTARDGVPVRLGELVSRADLGAADAGRPGFGDRSRALTRQRSTVSPQLGRTGGPGNPAAVGPAVVAGRAGPPERAARAQANSPVLSSIAKRCTSRGT